MLQGQPGELRFAIEIKRAATGKIEKYDLIGRIDNGRNPLDRSPQRGD